VWPIYEPPVAGHHRRAGAFEVVVEQVRAAKLADLEDGAEMRLDGVAALDVFGDLEDAEVGAELLARL